MKRVKSTRTQFIILIVVCMGILSFGMLTVSIHHTATLSYRASARYLNYYAQKIERGLDRRLIYVQQVVDYENDANKDWSSDTDVKKAQHRRQMAKVIGDDYSVLSGQVPYDTGYFLIFNSQIGGLKQCFIYTKQNSNDKVYKKQELKSYKQIYFQNIEKLVNKRTEPFWTGMYVNPFTHKLTISYVSPVYVNHQLVAITGMNVDVEEMMHYVKAIKINKSGSAYLLHKNTVIWYDQDKKNHYASYQPTKKQLALMTKSASDLNQMIKFGYLGLNYYGAYTTLENNFKLIVIMPAHEVDRIKIQEIIELLEVFALCLVIALFIVILYVRKVIAPIEDLTKAATEFAKGNMDFEIKERGPAEIQTLAHTFKKTKDILQENMDSMKIAAYQDSLTRVKSKAAFDIAVVEINQYHPLETFGIVMVDCNELKKVNDQYGHMMGDIMIKQSCRAICRIYAHSPVYRVGGDEFIVILRDEDYERRDELFEMIQVFAKKRDYNGPQPWLEVSMASGMAVSEPTDRSFDDVFNRADQKMYECKKNTGNARDK